MLLSDDMLPREMAKRLQKYILYYLLLMMHNFIQFNLIVNINNKYKQNALK